MDENRLARLLRRLDEPAEPDPGFSEALYRDLRAGTRPARRTLGSSLLVAALVVLLTALGIGMAVGSGLIRLPMMVADSTPTPASSPTARASPAASPAETPAATPTASQAATPTPTATHTPMPRLAIDSLVEPGVAGLNVRREPSLAAERLGTLREGSISFVADGPVFADGHEWYLLSAPGVPPNSGCTTPIETDPYSCHVWFGWVAAGDTNGTTWLVPHDVACPPTSGPLEDMALSSPGFLRLPLELLACWGDAELTIQASTTDAYARDGECTASEEIAWLYCVDDSILSRDGRYPASVAIDPQSGVTLPPPGQPVEVVAHLDDPRAADCAAAAGGSENFIFYWEYGGEEPAEAVLRCRATMVVTAVSPAE